MNVSNRFISSAFSTRNSFLARNINFSTIKTVTYASVSNGGVIMDPFYRDASERPHAGRGRSRHLGIDVTGPVSANGAWDDPRRGQTVYSAIKHTIPLVDIRNAKAFDKRAGQNYQININGLGDATLFEVNVKKQPWIPTDDHSYGGIVALHCVYTYTNASGTTSQFTLYVEYLHLITDVYLPKDRQGNIATLQYWNGLQRGINFGQTIENNNNQVVPASTFAGPNFPIVGYLGATQTPHVHIQVAYFNGINFSRDTNIRVDPNVMVL